MKGVKGEEEEEEEEEEGVEIGTIPGVVVVTTVAFDLRMPPPSLLKLATPLSRLKLKLDGTTKLPLAESSSPSTTCITAASADDDDSAGSTTGVFLPELLPVSDCTSSSTTSSDSLSVGRGPTWYSDSANRLFLTLLLLLILPLEVLMPLLQLKIAVAELLMLWSLEHPLDELTEGQEEEEMEDREEAYGELSSIMGEIGEAWWK